MLRGKGMEWFVDKEEDFVVSAGLDGEPEKMDEGWSDVLPGFSVGENPGGWVLDVMEPVQGFTG